MKTWLPAELRSQQRIVGAVRQPWPVLHWQVAALCFEAGYETVISGREGRRHLIIRARWDGRSPGKFTLSQAMKEIGDPKRARLTSSASNLLEARFHERVKPQVAVVAAMDWATEVYERALEMPLG